MGKRHTDSVCSIPTTRKDEEIVREEEQKMEMQRIESKFEICIFGVFFYFVSDDLRYLLSNAYESRCYAACECVTLVFHRFLVFVPFHIRSSFDFVCGLYVLFSRCKSFVCEYVCFMHRINTCRKLIRYK